MSDFINECGIFISELNEEHATLKYAQWLNDPEINKFLESRHTLHTVETCKKFISDMLKSESDFLFGVFTKEGKHIGNIKLTISNKLYRVGEIGLLIGDKEYWGKGIGTKAISLVTDFGFKKMGLKKIEAGCYEKNLGSLSCFLKCGFVVEGFIQNNVELNGSRMGSFRLGISG